MAKRKVAKKSTVTRSPKAIPTTHKRGRYEDVPFVFYDDERTIHQKGVVVIREDAMVLEIPEQDGYPPALVIGKPSGHFFRGTNTVRDEWFIPVDASWADLGDLCVGTWQDGNDDFIFYFRLPR